VLAERDGERVLPVLEQEAENMGKEGTIPTLPRGSPRPGLAINTGAIIISTLFGYFSPFSSQHLRDTAKTRAGTSMISSLARCLRCFRAACHSIRCNPHCVCW
jgi:hypothetical protein